MRFVFPCLEYEKKAEDFVQEFFDYSVKIFGTGGLARYLVESTYEKWLAKIISNLDIANIPDDKIASFTYFYVRERDDTIIGMINICTTLNNFLREEGGHITFSIRPSEQRKGYGTQMLWESLEFCHRIGLREVFLCCAAGSPSSKVAKNCAGVLSKEYYSDYHMDTMQRYIITPTRERIVL